MTHTSCGSDYLVADLPVNPAMQNANSVSAAQVHCCSIILELSVIKD